MLDARNVYRKVTRKIYDFSPEQEQNLLAIVWLYRGESERFLGLVSRYLEQVVEEGQACFHRYDGSPKRSPKPSKPRGDSSTGSEASPSPSYMSPLPPLRMPQRTTTVAVFRQLLELSPCRAFGFKTAA